MTRTTPIELAMPIILKMDFMLNCTDCNKPLTVGEKIYQMQIKNGRGLQLCALCFANAREKDLLQIIDT